MNTPRLDQILTLAQSTSPLRADALAQVFGVTVQTIRRDLRALCASGALERTHGGAILPLGVRNIGHSDRRSIAREAKSRIARAAAQLVPNGASLFLNIGTTTEAVARALLDHRDLMIVTNNLNIANILAANLNCEVILAGGRLRRADGGLVGDMTSDMIRAFKVDFAIIGTSAIDPDGDLLDFDSDEVRVSRTILTQSRKRILVADASKFTRHAPVRIASLGEVDHLITDAQLSEALTTACQDWSTRITRV